MIREKTQRTCELWKFQNPGAIISTIINDKIKILLFYGEL